MVAMLLFYILQKESSSTKAASFLKIYCHTLFQDPMLCGDSTAPKFMHVYVIMLLTVGI
jgi:hypothetical protein